MMEAATRQIEERKKQLSISQVLFQGHKYLGAYDLMYGVKSKFLFSSPDCPWLPPSRQHPACALFCLLLQDQLSLLPPHRLLAL